MVTLFVVQNYLNLQSLPDVDDVTDNDVFETPLLQQVTASNDADTRRASTFHSSDSQYASLTNSEHASSPANSLRSCAGNYLESSGVEYGSEEDMRCV